MATTRDDDKDPLAPKPAPKPQGGVGSPLAPEKERTAGDVGVKARDIGTDKDPRADQEITEDETEETVNVNLADWNEKHPYPPQGPGTWMFRFSGPEDKEKEAETRSYSSDYGFAQQQAAAEAREEGVETLTLDPGSPHG